MSETTTWWSAWLGEVVPVEVVKETAHTVTVRTPGGDERRNKTAFGGERFFRTEAEAIAYLFANAEQQVVRCQERLDDTVRRLAELRARYPNFKATP